MKKLTRILMVALSLIIAMSLFAACDTNENSGNTYTVKVWAPADDEFLISRYADGFKDIAAEKYPGYNIKIDYKTMAEPDSANAIITDALTAADVFIFPDDQIISLQSAGVLREITETQNKADVIARNTEKSIDAATVGGKLLAYPMTGDNTFFMIYDKRVVSETQAKKMDDVLNACQTAGKKMFMDVSNGWYLAGFFFATGGNLSLDTDGKSLLCDFNNDNGQNAAEGIWKITNHPAHMTGDDNTIKGTPENFGAMITGAWNLTEITKKWGAANVGLAKLPTYTTGDGEQTQMMSFGGHKLVGVNKFTQVGNIAAAFADYMTSEEGQWMRFEERENAPTNKVVAARSEINDSPIIKVVLEQFKYSHPQSQVTGAFWDPTDAFGTVLENKDLEGKSLKEWLDIMVAAITAKS